MARGVDRLLGPAALAALSACLSTPAAPQGGADAGTCPSGAATGCSVTQVVTCDGSTSCYVLCDESPPSQTWENARLACEAWGGHLAVIDSATEDQCLSGLATDDRIWIGFRQDVEAMAPGAGWKPLVGTSTYVRWATNQPDDRDGTENHETDCGELMEVQVGGWNDRWCGDPNRYICELER